MKLNQLLEATTSAGPLKKFGVFYYSSGEDISQNDLGEIEIFLNQKAFYRHIAESFGSYLDMVGEDAEADALEAMTGDNEELKAKLAKRKGKQTPFLDRTLEQLEKHPHWSGFAEVTAIADKF